MHYFILGPSGSGKSHVAKEFAASISAVWYEADPWPPVDGINSLSLRTEWDALVSLENSDFICDEFDRRAKEAGKSSVVLSLPSFPLLTVSHAAKLKDRARIIYLSGTPDQCLGSFLRREKETGRNLDVHHWCTNNSMFFRYLERPDFQPLVISNFNADGSYRRIEDVFSDLKR